MRVYTIILCYRIKGFYKLKVDEELWQPSFPFSSPTFALLLFAVIEFAAGAVNKPNSFRSAVLVLLWTTLKQRS